MPPLGQVPPGAFRPLRTPLTTPLAEQEFPAQQICVSGEPEHQQPESTSRRDSQALYRVGIWRQGRKFLTLIIGEWEANVACRECR